ncbi:MAG TPA: LLM class flavin-dependent oxidoreductase, partial [Acidimicrobiales bacterium]|nr:LLM class flavin-dependent oxidoreductase [Acidimicrobiales bacterium]
DKLSEPENLAYGVPFPSATERLAQLADCCRLLRAEGLPVWVGGLSPRTIAVAGREADGLNLWAVGRDAMTDAVDMLVRDVGGRDFTLTWGGGVLVARNEELAAGRLKRTGTRPGLVHGTLESVAAHFRDLGEAGAEWIICAPLDWSVPVEELELLAELAEALR